MSKELKDIEAIRAILEKARQKLSDEYDPNDEVYDDKDHDRDDLSEFDPNSDDMADRWLAENDPEANDPEAKAQQLKLEEAKAKKAKAKASGDKYSEYEKNEDEDAHQRSIAEDMGEDLPIQDEDEAFSQNPVKTSNKRSRFQQPTREELNALRVHTRPLEHRNREIDALWADPAKNPELARHGNIIEARNASHSDRSAAYRDFTNSDDYKSADPIQQMEMDDQFEHKWKQENPEHLKNALNAHKEAHEKGKGARDIHAANKDAKIQNILRGGGHGGEGYSLEEGMQHAGGTKGEEGTQGTIVQDPAASYANNNRDFVEQYAKDYANKGKKINNIDDMSNYDEGSKRDITRILGEGPGKDPKFEKFFSHYHPLIHMHAKKALAAMGLDQNHPNIELGSLNEAGMHGLIQAINDYDHDNPSKASFSTHAGNKIRGLQMSALKSQDAIPKEVRQAQKRFAAQGQKPPASKVDLHSLIGSSGHAKAPDIQDRLQRVGAQRQSQAVKIRKAPTSGNTSGGT